MDAATMESVVDLTVDLDRAGVQELEAEGNTLRYRPRSAMTPDLRQRLTDLKPDVLAAHRGLGPVNGARGPGAPESHGSQPGAGEIDWWSLIRR